MEIKQIKELARVMKENDLTALEIHEEGSSIRLERNREIAAVPASSLPGTAGQASSPFTPAGAEPAAPLE